MTVIDPHIFWRMLSFLGSTNITASLAFALAICLLTSGNYRVAQCWILLFGVTMMIVGATKLAFIGWGIGLATLDFTGMSGHAARAAAVYPALSYMLSKNSSPVLRRAAITAAFVLSFGVALARVVWKVHSLSEVATGYLLGAAVAVAYLNLNHGDNWPSLRSRFACVSVAAVIAVCLPAAPTQYWMIKTGLALSGHEQPFSRDP